MIRSRILFDSLTLKVAKNLAREVAYRGFKGTTPSALTPAAKPSSKGKVNVSVVKSNALGAIFYSIISSSISISLLMAGQIGSSVTNTFSISLTILVGFAFALSLMQVAPFTSTFIREGLVDLLRLLPLTNSQILRVYLVALTLYWGGLSLIFIFVPFFMVSAYVVMEGTLPGTYLLLGLFAMTSLFIFSYSLGMALGSYSYAVRRRASLRLMSTIAWLLSFMMMFLFYRISSIIVEVAKNLEPVLLTWGAFIPFVGPLFSITNPILMLSSITGNVLLVVVAYMLARVRISKVFFGGAEYSMIARVEFMKRIKVSETKLRVKGLINALVCKDLKLLSRESRRLASMLFLVLLPIIMFVSLGFNSHTTKHSAYLIFITSSILGAFSGLASEYVFYAEGAGALVLYYLPLRKRDIALAKALACSLITIPISVAIIFGLTIYFTGDIVLAVISVMITIMLNLGFSFISSTITISMLPKNPSEWSEYSFKASMGTRFVRSIVKLAVLGIGIGILLMILLFASLIGISPETIKLFTIAYAAIFILVSIVFLYVVAGSKPL